MNQQETQPNAIIACGLTQDAINKLKSKHGRVFIVTIKDDAEELQAICKEPDSNIMSAVNSVSKTDEVKGAVVLYNSCVIEADAAIKESDLLKMRVAAAIGDKIGRLTYSIKNA